MIIATAPRTLEVWLPIPPREMGKNGSHRSYIAHQRMFNAAKNDAKIVITSELNGIAQSWQAHAGPVVLFYRWFAAGGTLPDPDNITGRLAPYQDAAQAAGVFENDRQVMATLPLHIGQGGKRNARVELVFACVDESDWAAMRDFAADTCGVSLR